mgnify:CR=1 FL=1
MRGLDALDRAESAPRRTMANPTRFLSALKDAERERFPAIGVGDDQAITLGRRLAVHRHVGDPGRGNPFLARQLQHDIVRQAVHGNGAGQAAGEIGMAIALALAACTEQATEPSASRPQVSRMRNDSTNGNETAVAEHHRGRHHGARRQQRLHHFEDLHALVLPDVVQLGGGVELAQDLDKFAAANALLELKRYDDASGACGRYAVRYPKSDLLDSYWYVIGYCHFALGEHEQALEMCRKVAEANVAAAAAA